MLRLVGITAILPTKPQPATPSDGLRPVAGRDRRAPMAPILARTRQPPTRCHP